MKSHELKLRFWWRGPLSMGAMPAAAAILSLAIAGCSTMSVVRAPGPGYHRSARVAPPETPSYTPAADEPIAILGEPETAMRVAPGAHRTESPPAELPAESLVPGSSEGSSRQETGPRLDGPAFPGEPAAKGKLELQVRSPAKGQIGSQITYELTVRNVSGTDLQDVVVESEFDASLRFPGSQQKRVRQSIEKVPSGETRSMALTLIAEEAGNCCCRFSVASRGMELAWKSVCTAVASRKSNLTLVGPMRRFVGGRAEFTAKLVNSSEQRWTGVEAEISYPAALVPREASTGARQTTGALSWKVGDLEPGEGVQLQVEFECRTVVDQAGVAVRVSGADVDGTGMESRLDVVPPGGGVQLDVSDGHDPISVGEHTEYLVRVQNRAVRGSGLVEITAEVPEILQVVSAEAKPSRAGGREPDVRIQGNRVVWRSKTEDFRAGDALLLRIRVKALREGDGWMTVRSTKGAGGDPPVEIQEATTVNR